MIAQCQEGGRCSHNRLHAPKQRTASRCLQNPPAPPKPNQTVFTTGIDLHTVKVSAKRAASGVTPEVPRQRPETPVCPRFPATQSANPPVRQRVCDSDHNQPRAVKHEQPHLSQSARLLIARRPASAIIKATHDCRCLATKTVVTS